MAIEPFNLSSLVGLDQGRIKETFEQAIRRCEADCKDRPALKDARTVTLKVTIAPVPEPDGGELQSCDVRFQVTDSVPKRRSKVYNMRSTRSGLHFNELSPDDINQTTIDEAPGPRSETDAG
ncbi:MAG: hypothetical protein GY711_11460 [bacterium]|nr:hypothetical protein [bacterium]